MDLGLEGKCALVTGGSKGIGLATAQLLAAEGASVHLAARGQADLESAQRIIEQEHGGSVTVHSVDLSDGDAARELAAACPEIDILVNNAGAIAAGTLGDIEEPLWRSSKGGRCVW